MVRRIRIDKVIRTLAHRKRIERMIRNIKNIEMDVNDKNNKFDYLVNHVIKINNRIQSIIWERGLLSNTKKYEALRSNL